MGKSLIKVFIIFISFSQISIAFHENFMEADKKFVKENLTSAVHSIIENVFLKLFTTVNVITAIEKPRDSYFLDFIESLLRKSKGYEIYRLDNHTHIRTIKFRLKIYNTILLDSFKTFLLLERNIVTTAFNFRGYFLFVLVNGKIPEIGEIFARMFAKKIVNVNVIYEENDEVEIMTFTPFKANNCRNTVPVHWAKYIGNETFDVPFKQIFPDELSNFRGCEIKMAAFERCPASCIQYSAGKPKLVGFDVEIVEAIEEALNFKLKLDILEGSEQWGDIKNKTTTGAISKVVNNECDFTAGNFLLRASRVEVMDPSVVYLSFPVVFAIPLGVKLTDLEKLLRPFELVVWIFMLSFLGIGVLVIFVINWKFKKFRDFVYGTGIRHPIVNMTVAVLGGMQVKLPRRNFARFILMMFLIFCLVQRNVYQGILYIFIQSDSRHKEVQSIREMSKKNFSFYMYESYSDIVQSVSEIYGK